MDMQVYRAAAKKTTLVANEAEIWLIKIISPLIEADGSFFLHTNWLEGKQEPSRWEEEK